MGDIDYLSIKKFDGKRVDVNTQTTILNTSTETDIVTATANTGKDMYLASAKLNFQMATSGPLFEIVYKLYIKKPKYTIISHMENFKYEFL